MRGPVVVGGAVARRVEHGGHVWALLQWAVGLRRLGHPVLFLDRLHPDEEAWSPERVRRFAEAMRYFGLEGAWSLDLGPDREPLGLSRPEVVRTVRESDFLLNVMGYIEDATVLGAARRRVFLDIDPGFPQMWEALGYCDMFAGHDAFLTLGRNIGREGCPVPPGGRSWIHVSPPVVADLWRPVPRHRNAYTSVASWRGPYAPVAYGGETYGLRVHEFRRFASVPRDCALGFEIALDIAPEDGADARRLRAGGWQLVDPAAVAGGPRSYREYVRASKAEFQVAKGMYVRSRSGWLSDRTVCYLAAGRPALVQDTGLGDHLPTGEGLVTFGTPEEAVDAARRIDADWLRHARAARDLARTHFDARRVLGGLVDAVAA